MINLKQCLLERQYILGTMVSEVTTPNIARMLAAGGFSFIIIDCEHGYFDYAQAAGIVGIANGIHLPVIVRIPEIRREVITKYMDMGADGLLVPMTGTAEAIAEVVRFSKYAPMGRRGISTQRAHSEYNPPPLKQYMEAANGRTVILAQIETREGVGNIDEILSVKGVDGALIGPNDLACDCGTPGEFGTDEMRAHISAVIAAGGKAGKPTGIISGSIPLLRDCRQQGMTVFSCNSEAGMILSASKQIVRDMAKSDTN